MMKTVHCWWCGREAQVDPALPGSGGMIRDNGTMDGSESWLCTGDPDDCGRRALARWEPRMVRLDELNEAGLSTDQKFGVLAGGLQSIADIIAGRPVTRPFGIAPDGMVMVPVPPGPRRYYTHADFRQVQCPYCHAGAGQPCVTRTAGTPLPLDRMHAARVHAVKGKFPPSGRDGQPEEGNHD